MIIDGQFMQRIKKPFAAVIVSLVASLIAACSPMQNEHAANLASGLSKFQRTTSCVYGNLPMDVQFNIQRSPPRINKHTSFGDTEANTLQHALDIRLLELIKTSMAEALAKQPIGNVLNYKELSLDFEDAAITHAADSLHLTFCGGAQEVGSTVMAALSGWFSRSVDNVQDTDPLTQWFSKIGPKATSHEVDFVMLATALHAERPDISTSRLLGAFRTYAASHDAH